MNETRNLIVCSKNELDNKKQENDIAYKQENIGVKSSTLFLNSHL
jgi:hypothetical protein